MITPSELETLNDEDMKRAADMEGAIDALLMQSIYFGAEISYSVPDKSGPFGAPARVWFHVLKKYVAAGWNVEPALEHRLFSRPVYDKEEKAFPIISIRAKK